MTELSYPPVSGIASVCAEPAGVEKDEEFVSRHFRDSVAALERVQALQPGEFEELVAFIAPTDVERRKRSRRHEEIARRALKAVQQYLLREEEFNIWSGRRKEEGIPIRPRFEEIYERINAPDISCRRGTLTGIVRAYQRLLDEKIADLFDEGEWARNAAELLAAERRAVAEGFLEFQRYTFDTVAGWPTFMRSSGKLRGALRLRCFFDERQSALPMDPEQSAALLEGLRDIPAEEKG